MMEVKLFELRDHGTFIPLLCIKPSYDVLDSFVARMVWRYGYKDSRAVIVLHMGSPERGCQSDPYGWNDRTFTTAHAHVEANWESLKTGDLLDVRVILGEATEPCESEARATP